MRNYIQKHSTAIILVCVSIISLIGIYWAVQTYLLKVELAKKELLIDEAQRPSQVEEMVESIKNYKNEANLNIKKINLLEEKLKEQQVEYERNVLKARCYDVQVDRYATELEVVDWYCEDESNLEKFRSKK